MEQLYTFHLFAGAGGGILADALLGHWPVGAVEVEPYARRVLHARQRDGLLPPFPVWDDVRTFRADNPECSEFIEGLRSIRDRLVVCGGFPCQDISAAGKGAGISGARSGLWNEMARIVREVRPRYVFVENSPMLTSRGIHRVLGDMAEMGFDARWGVLGAHHAGAPHKRDRIWIFASNADRQSKPAQPVDDEASRVSSMEMADAPEKHGSERTCGALTRKEQLGGRGRRECAGWWDAEPAVGRVADGVASRVDRLRALGNGQVPAVAALAWQVLSYDD